MPAVINILLALRRRDLTGEGCRIDVSMADGVFAFGWYALAEGHVTGRFPGPRENELAGGLPRYAVYATADDRFLAVGALEEKFWRIFCDAIALDARFRDDRATPRETRAEVACIVRGRTAADWERLFAPLDCCVTVVATFEEALADPHFKARGVQDALVMLPDGSTLPAAAVPIVPALRLPRNRARRRSGATAPSASNPAPRAKSTGSIAVSNERFKASTAVVRVPTSFRRPWS